MNHLLEVLISFLNCMQAQTEEAEGANSHLYARCHVMSLTPRKALVSTYIVQRGFEGAIFLLQLLSGIFTNKILILLLLDLLFSSLNCISVSPS